MQYAEIAIADGLLFDTEPEPKCEYRHAQWDNGTQSGLMIPCRKPAVCWALGGGLRCEEHKGD